MRTMRTTAHHDPSCRAAREPAGSPRGTDRVVAPARPSQRAVTATLGVIWLVDGVLQLQPSMFSTSFATGTLAGAGAGQPWWVLHSVAHLAHDLAPHIAQWNVVFALVQLAIGACLVANRRVRPALAASVAWSLGVWWFGEGFGGIFSGRASLVTGAPGAVLLYGLLAVLVWPRRHGRATATSAAGPAPTGPGASVTGAGIAGAAAGRAAWVVLWVGGALLQVLPANRSDAAVSSAIRGGAAGEPHALASLATAAAHLVGTRGAAAAIALAVAEAAIGVGVLARRPNVALAAGIAASLVFWVVGQQLGGILTGSGTDPNAGPLFVLLALALWQGVPVGARARAQARARARDDGDGDGGGHSDGDDSSASRAPEAGARPGVPAGV